MAERIRRDVASLILATDMSRHADYVGDFERRVQRGFDLSSREDVDSLKHVLIKACDISNECRPVGVAEAWADCLLTEYFKQVRLQLLVYNRRDARDIRGHSCCASSS